MPLQATSGAASYDAFGGGAPAAGPTYIEDVFNTFVWSGTTATRTITNDIDLSGKGGLVWTKRRSDAVEHLLYDTTRGALKSLSTNDDTAENSYANTLTAFGSTGFTLGSSSYVNATGQTYVGWTFRKQPKFFDIVTWTGDGTGNRSIPHLLGSTPAFIQTKLTSGVDAWWNHHSSVTSPNANWWRNYGLLNNAAEFSDWGDNSGLYQSPDATNLYIGSYYNGSGKTYVAYLFAHNAGGFGLTGTDNVISCGSYVGDGTTRLINIGFEPQWILIKNASSSTAPQADWRIVDNMRGFTATGNSAILKPHLSDAETNDNPITIASQGFNTNNLRNTGNTYIYIAIRRGPMKVPTTGTSVFSPQIYTEIVTNPTTLTTSFATDLHMISRRTGTPTFYVADRLRGSVLNNENLLETSSTAAETDYSSSPPLFTSNTGIVITNLFNNISSQTDVSYQFRRAPSFMDVVCYTGTGSSMSLTHNLGVGPELIIIKRRNSTSDWQVAAKINSTEYTVGASGNELALNSSGGGTTTYFTYATYFNSTAFQTGAFWTSPNVNTATYVAYLFATCAGVSKVGSYTGNGSSQTINCGFTGGARFVLIKKSSGTGDWMVSDSARGIVSGSDPYLELNNTNAEVTGEDWLDTDSTGFVVNEVSGSNANTNGATYIFLAIA
jgi:hypothetical protein